MEKNSSKLVRLLNDKNLSQVDIGHILIFAQGNNDILESLYNLAKESSKEGKYLMSDLLSLEVELAKKYKPENIEFAPFEDEEKSEKEPISVHTIYYNVEDSSDKMLHVTFDSSDVGSLKMLGPTSSINSFDISINLAYMDLKELENDTRESFRKIDLYKYENEDNMIYSFKSSVDALKQDINNYTHIIIWSKHNDTNGYLIPYYFINRFLDNLYDKKIMIIYTDELANCDGLDELKIGQFRELMETATIVFNDDLKEYSDKWDEIKEHNCEIRNYVNNKIEYKNAEDYFNIIESKLKEKGEVVRSRFIGELMQENILNGGIPDIYSYIIDKMIEKGIINSRDYSIGQFIPVDKISVANK